jgi:uncharacterized membrane-anchored protein YhcB (DUF1043 family)
MPRAELPTTARGWLVALVASFVGFISGFVTIRLLQGIAA